MSFHNTTLETDQLLQQTVDGKYTRVTGDQFTDLSLVRREFRSMMSSTGVLYFLAFVKLFKYATIFRNFDFLFRILMDAKVQLMSFAMVFFLLVIAFAFAGVSIFGHQAREFHNVATAIVSLIRLSVGVLDFDYSEWKKGDAFLAPLFLAFYLFGMLLVSINMFISILSGYYSKVSTALDQRREDERLMELEGTRVPHASLTYWFTRLYQSIFINWSLLLDAIPKGVPDDVLVVDRIAHPDSNEESAARDYDSSSLVRVHFHSSFQPADMPKTPRDGRGGDEETSSSLKRGHKSLGAAGAALLMADVNSQPTAEDGGPSKPLFTNPRMNDIISDEGSVVCVRLGDDRMFQDGPAGTLGSMNKGELITLRESTHFGTNITLKLEELSNMERTNEFGRYQYCFALFRAVTVTSWQRYGGKSTVMNLDESSWTHSQDVQVCGVLKLEPKSAAFYAPLSRSTASLVYHVSGYHVSCVCV